MPAPSSLLDDDDDDMLRALEQAQQQQQQQQQQPQPRPQPQPQLPSPPQHPASVQPPAPPAPVRVRPRHTLPASLPSVGSVPSVSSLFQRSSNAQTAAARPQQQQQQQYQPRHSPTQQPPAQQSAVLDAPEVPSHRMQQPHAEGQLPPQWQPPPPPQQQPPQWQPPPHQLPVSYDPAQLAPWQQSHSIAASSDGAMVAPAAWSAEAPGYAQQQQQQQPQWHQPHQYPPHQPLMMQPPPPPPSMQYQPPYAHPPSGGDMPPPPHWQQAPGPQPAAYPPMQHAAMSLPPPQQQPPHFQPQMSYQPMQQPQAQFQPQPAAAAVPPPPRPPVVPASPAAAAPPQSSPSPDGCELVHVDPTSLLPLFVHYFPLDWPGGPLISAPHEADNRRVVRERNPKFPIVERLSRFFHTYRHRYIMDRDVRTWSRVLLDYPSFCAAISEEIPGLEAEMAKQPALILATLQCALHHTCISPSLVAPGAPPDPSFRPLEFALPSLQVRLRDFRPRVSLRSAGHAMHLGRFLAVQGTVVRVAPARPAVRSMAFACTRCHRTQRVPFKDNLFVSPEACTPPCHNKTFEPDRRSAACVDRQIIKLQEIFQNTSNNPSNNNSSVDAHGSASSGSSPASSAEDQAHVPRTLDVHLYGGDLVDCCVPGDVVSVCGFIRSRKMEEGVRGRKSSVFALYLEANAVTKTAEKEASEIETTATSTTALTGGNSGTPVTPLFSQPSRLAVSTAFDPLADFSPLELEAILAFVCSTPNPFKMLVASLCPTIFGNEVVKAGLILALVGGVSKHAAAATPATTSDGGVANDSVSVRGDIHALLVGDPGLGKSQMLRSVSRVSPRGIYVSGGRTSKAGLTVTMVKDGSGGDYSLDAGALVLADQGVCCIDEFDKMTAEHPAMLEVMEQQSISMAKANMLCRLAARTTVVAAANPAGGHYDRSKTLSENVRMSAPLLSRFDLVFILLDRPDTEQDARLSEHVVKQHGMVGGRRYGGTRGGGAAAGLTEDMMCTPPRGGAGLGSDDSPSSRAATRPLASKLRVRPHDRECLWQADTGELDLLPVPALRKYIAYARKYCRPLLSAGARSRLQAFFLHLRSLSAMSPADSTPVTIRQLEALVRMSEARARLELQEVVTPQHAQDVIDLMRESRAGMDSWGAGAGARDGEGDAYGSSSLEADMALAASLAPPPKAARAGSKAALKRQFIALLRQRAEARGGDPVFSAAELYTAHEQAGLRKHVDDFDAFVDALNVDNCLLRIGPRKYKLVAAGM